MSSILSGEKMVLAHSKTNYELPPVGVKEFQPNNSWLEQKQIQSALDHRKTLLEAERVEKESNLMRADWRPEKHKAAVSRKGKHWETFGHHADNTDWLFPEEALFLMEMNCLECLFGEVPLSIQKGYSVFLKPDNGCTLNEYRVFAHLCRAGYRVLRHLPNLTVTAYERTIRLDQHLKERKTYNDVDGTEETSSKEKVIDASKTQVAGEPEESIAGKTRMPVEQDEIITEKSQLSKKPGETIKDQTKVLDKSEKMVTGQTSQLNKSVTSCVGELTKRKLRKIQRRNAKLREKLMTLQGGRVVKKSPALQTLQRRQQHSIVRKYMQQTKHATSTDQYEAKPNDDIQHSSTPDSEDETPEIPSDRWQPPVVISDLPENIEMTIGAMPGQDEESLKAQGIIEIIDIADTSSEEDVETDEVETDEVESDSDIEIIEEIRPPTHNDNKEDDEEEDDLEIIEVPIPKKEIIVETLSSDSEEEGSSSESEKSYDGNWKRSMSTKKSKFVRPPTMSHLTFAAVDEFCEENKSKDNVNGEDKEFIALESSNPRVKQPLFRVEKTRNEILDSMPTMAGQNRKLLTLDIPNLQFIPDGIFPKQKAYTYSTNALRARVFRQGFRGRRNFHGPRFTSFNPYYNNTNGNYYPNQLSIGGPQGLFQAPQLTQMLGGGDINSVARGVMQIASALLMNLPQNNMNNGLLPYNPRPNFHQHFPQIESSNLSTPQFPRVNQNFSYNEPSNMNHHGFNVHQRNDTNLQSLFDMPQQRNFGSPNHVRFSDDASSPVVENNRSSQNCNVDLSRSSESDFDSSDHNFTPPIGNRHSVSSNFRDNRAANFRSRRGRFRGKPPSHGGRFRGKPPSHRGGFPQRNFRGGTSNHSLRIDPAYVKPDVPIPGEQSSISQRISDFIPISSSTSNQESEDIISIDDDDGFVPRGGISNRFSKKKRRKRKLMRLKENTFKKKCLNPNSEGGTNPEIIFLGSPPTSKPYTDESSLESVKQENEADVQVKTETGSEQRNVKQEEMETPAGTSVKQESVKEHQVKAEKEVETRVKTEGVCGESSGVRVKVEQGESGKNVRVEIKIESSSDTSSVVSLPLTNLVKEEPCKLKIESVERSEVKTEAVDVVERVKTESLDQQESKEGIMETTVENSEIGSEVGETSDRPEVESMDISGGEAERTKQNENESGSVDRVDSSLEAEVEERNDVGGNSSEEMLCSRPELASEEIINKKISSWAEMKKNNLPLHTFQDTESQDEAESENEDEDEIRPLLRPKHCKTISTVLSALQIFTPSTAPPPDNVLRLRISFDLYPPAEFRKSHRGLPQYRIMVFGGTEPLPSPAQLREVNSRFQDRVPVLTAVVTPGSVVFYTFTDVDLPQDSTSYTK